MKIVICDDNREDLLKTEELLLKYREQHPGLDFELDKYLDAVLLYQKIQENAQADIYILDMMMDGKNGIDLGLEVRKTCGESEIIYITLSDDFALDAYGVRAGRYLLKPVKEKDFLEALDHAFSCIRAREDAFFLVKTKDGLESAAHSQIEYVESSSRALTVHLADGRHIRSIFIRKSFEDEVRSLVNDNSFVQVHKSFVIHLKYVWKLGQRSVVMKSGRAVPVSKSRMADVKREYLSYALARYG